MDKQEITDALSKSLKDISDVELKGILTVPEQFWPTNPFDHSTKIIMEEQIRRINAKKMTYQEILDDVIYLSTLRHLISFGPRVFPELDLLGIDDATGEIQRLQKIVRDRIKKFKAQ